MRVSSLFSPEILLRNWKFVKKFRFVRKFGLKICLSTMVKLEGIERFIFFLQIHNRQTQVYRLVWGPTDVQFLRYRDFQTEGDDCALQV